MPELPEVETTKSGIEPFVVQQTIKKFSIHQPQLRWLIPDEVTSVVGQKALSVERRAKYLLWHFEQGSIILHLGMSGAIRIVDASLELKKHDHVVVDFENGQSLRFNDPRRFGAILWQAKGETLAVMSALGPEPLEAEFNGKYLHHAISKRKGAIKNAIMTNKVVVGVGNIYASEALFLSGIHPNKAANKLSKQACTKLVANIKQVLAKAIQQGGTTLKDFTQADGSPGYFAQQLNVYGREGEACFICKRSIKRLVIGQRASYYCPKCQS